MSAVYEMMGTESSNLMKAQELFRKMDQNSDGLVSQVVILLSRSELNLYIDRRSSLLFAQKMMIF